MSLSELVNYQVQLQQVEAALITDPQNDDLFKLKSDLEEAIKLTKSLMGIDGEKESNLLNQPQTLSQSHKFNAGDPCMAPWSEDGQFYEAIIEDLTSDGQCNVVFHYLPNGKFKVSEVCLVSLLKPSLSQRKKNKIIDSSKNNLNKKHDGVMNRELIKKRQLKKLNRFKELEEAREKDKNKWKQFNQKAIGKNLKGAVTLVKKQSIFKSPETVEGKVGVGTCGIGGKPMTNFTVGDKYKRGTLGNVAKPLNSKHYDSIYLTKK